MVCSHDGRNQRAKNCCLFADKWCWNRVMLWTEPCCLKFFRCGPNPDSDCIRGEYIQEVIKVKWSPQSRALIWQDCGPVRRREVFPSLSFSAPNHCPPCEGPVRRPSPASQEEGTHQNLTTLALWPHTPSPHSYEKINSYCLNCPVPHSMVFC